MEVKRASPSGHRGRHSVAAASRAYAFIADAVSVLTDGPAFGGRLQDIATVRRNFDGPILAKDFIVDPRQVAEARRFGADAVLAILSVLDDAAAAAVLREAERMGMDVIVEVHGRAELKRAAALGAGIVGINNRDLKTLATDLDTTRRLAAEVPAGTLVVSESGIRTRGDVKALAPMVDGFLVGSALMAAPNIGEEARALVHGRVKVCGLTREQDVAAAAVCGATHAGLVLVPGTPRAVDVNGARPLARTAAAFGMKRVGIFRDATNADVLSAAEQLQLDVVQLHGREPDSQVAELRAALGTTAEVWAVCPVGDAPAEVRGSASRTVFDTAMRGRCGGTGRSFDWARLRGRPRLGDAVLAGGIRPANAAAADAVGMHALDIGSGVEARPGVKDRAKLRAVFSALRPLDRSSRCA